MYILYRLQLIAPVWIPAATPVHGEQATISEMAQEESTPIFPQPPGVELEYTTYVNLCTLLMYNVAMPLPGPIQTNNRSEIYAVVLFVQNIEITPIIELFTKRYLLQR